MKVCEGIANSDHFCPRQNIVAFESSRVESSEVKTMKTVGVILIAFDIYLFIYFHIELH